MPTRSLSARLRSDAPALVFGLPPVALFVFWAVDNGGYDPVTWYWGALGLLGLAAAMTVALTPARLRLPRPAIVALTCFGLYVAWSYASILWAQDQGAALEGSNRALMYLLTFGLMTALPWTREAAVAALLLFAVGIGVIAIVLLVHLAGGSRVSGLFVAGRLAAPTGYINSTAALFTMATLPGIALAARRELPGPLRGLLLACAAADLDLALIVQSRGWLFTLPVVAVAAILVIEDRLRVTVAAILPAIGAAIPARRLLHVYQNSSSDPLARLAVHAARPALMLCAGVFALGTLVAWGDRLRGERSLGAGTQRALAAALTTLAVMAALGAALAVSKGHPGRFIAREWHGFAHQQSASTSSHFTDVGSGRYDFWRVSLDAFAAHPVAGLGQDNFADYYMRHRRTLEEPSWTHSLELRLLVHTGMVGLLLFFAFLVAAVRLALRARRRGDQLCRHVAGAAMLPVIVWLIHGSLDWFWEMPALSGPALGFLAVAGSLAGTARPDDSPPPARPRAEPPARRRARVASYAAAGVALIAGTVVLGLPFLSAREVSLAGDLQGADPAAALAKLRTAGELNPLAAGPGRLAGAIALRTGDYPAARRSFRQAVAREPGGWFAWLGAGLAASAEGDRTAARRDYAVAYSINDRQPAVREALQRVETRHPLTSAAAFKLLVVAQ